MDLNSPGSAKLVASRIKADIDEFCRTEYDDGHRWHLGASLIGDACKRKLWYIFRWCFREKFDGRMQRLFNRGHREEDRFTEWLKGIGAIVQTHDENGKQLRVAECGGHFGGSLDGRAILPEKYGIPFPVLLEFKTSGTGKAFEKVVDSGMPIGKPLHFAQTSTYGLFYGYEWVLYFIICKNDDNLEVQLVRLDHNLGRSMVAKAEQIISSQVPPPRLSDNPTYFDCKYCAAKEICHGKSPVEKNCRSCKNATPVENGEWHCSVHNGIIPRYFVPTGCESYSSIV